MGQPVGRVGYLEMVGMHEIGVIAGLDAVQHRVAVIDHQIVPAHMWHFQRRVGRGDFHHLAGDPVKSLGILVLATPCGHHLHAHTDAKEGAGAGGDGLFDRLKEPTISPERLATGGKSTVAGQHDPVGAGHILGA